MSYLKKNMCEISLHVNIIKKDDELYTWSNGQTCLPEFDTSYSFYLPKMWRNSD